MTGQGAPTFMRTKVVRRDDFQYMMQDCRLDKIDLILNKSVTRLSLKSISRY